jgi:hypothetical protein
MLLHNLPHLKGCLTILILKGKKQSMEKTHEMRKSKFIGFLWQRLEKGEREEMFTCGTQSMPRTYRGLNFFFFFFLWKSINDEEEELNQSLWPWQSDIENQDFDMEI